LSFQFSFLDLKANLALNECESQYTQQIEEYQSNINRAIHETDQIRTELHQLQLETISKEKQTNDLIDTLKQTNEKLQTELNDRGKSINSLNFFF
jgi:predicted transcriptional regulator